MWKSSQLVPVAICLLLIGVVSASNRPNIVLIMADDLGWGDLQCYNPDSPIQTPHLNQMARDGMRFQRFYAAAPVCSPTRASCLTGRHPYRMGITHANVGHLPISERTLPELLRTESYKTGHFGKWHLGTLSKTVRDSNRGGPAGAAHFAPPSEHGFDVSFATEAKVPTFDPMWRPKSDFRTAWDAMTSPESDGEPYGTRYWNVSGQDISSEVHGDDSAFIMDKALAFVQQCVAEEKPFLATIWLHAPHLPVVASEPHRRPYAQYDVHFRNYYGCVSALDEQIGRFRQQLQHWQVDENTMIWFCSDNGPEGDARSPGSTGGLNGRKRSLLEGGIRVPGILVWPAIVAAGSVNDVPAVTSDFLPTFLDELDISCADDRPLDGMSLRNVIRQLQSERNQPIGFQSGKQLAWIADRYKVYSNDHGQTWQLFDIKADANETHDLAHEHPELVRQFAAQAKQWAKECRSDE